MPPCSLSTARHPIRGLAVFALSVTIAALFGAGCASRPVGTLSPGFAPGANPSLGKAVRVGTIRDQRRFRPLTTRGLEPSLNAPWLDDPDIRAHAVGRRRVRGDVVSGVVSLVPETTVASLVEQALVDALRAAGYRVVGPEADDYAEAIPFDANIENFWLRQRDAIHVTAVDVRADVIVRADLPGLQRGHRIAVHAVSSRGGGATGVMERGIDQALADVSARLQRRLEGYTFASE